MVIVSLLLRSRNAAFFRSWSSSGSHFWHTAHTLGVSSPPHIRPFVAERFLLPFMVVYSSFCHKKIFRSVSSYIMQFSRTTVYLSNIDKNTFLIILPKPTLYTEKSDDITKSRRAWLDRIAIILWCSCCFFQYLHPDKVFQPEFAVVLLIDILVGISVFMV